MELHTFDVVRLDDGREATILEFHPNYLIVERTDPTPDGFPSVLDISPAQVTHVLRRASEHLR